jgi:signal peptidase
MKKAIKITVNVLAWIFLALALLITLVVFSSEKNNGVSNIMGYMPMTVESDSMKPTFKKGDLIIVKEIDDVSDLKEDDIITFWTIIDGQRAKNTHRIVKVEKNGESISFITRGDNNNGIDDDLPVSSGDIIGKWTEHKIVGAGKVMDFLKTKKGFFICIIIPMAVFFLFELYKFIVTLIEVRKGDEEEIDEEEIKRRAIEEYLAEQKKKEAESAGEKAEEAVETVEEAVGEEAEKAAETVKETIEEKAEEVVEAVEETVEDKAEEVVEAVEETAEEKAEEAAEAVEETVEDKAEEVIETVTETAEIAEETVEETAGSIEDEADDKAEEAVQAVEDTAEEIVDNVKDAAETQEK